jgi:hypothetical protein
MPSLAPADDCHQVESGVRGISLLLRRGRAATLVAAPTLDTVDRKVRPSTSALASEPSPAAASAWYSPAPRNAPRYKYRVAELTRLPAATKAPAVWFELAGCCEIAPTGAGVA